MQKFRWHKEGNSYTLIGFGATVLILEAGFTASFSGRTKECTTLLEAFSWVEGLV